MTRVIHMAYLRDGKTIHHGESLLLACLMRAKGKGRASADMEDLLHIMRDPNVEKEHK